MTRSLPQFPRPRTRDECVEGGVLHMRPCPFVGCRYHLALDVRTFANGAVAIARVRPDFAGEGPLDEGADSCALDVQEAVRAGVREPLTLDEVGRALGVTRQFAACLEREALRKTSKRTAQ